MVVTVLLAACDQGAPRPSPSPVPIPAPAPAPAPAPQQEPPHAVDCPAVPNAPPLDVLVGLRRLGCYGSCPSYLVTVDQEGRVRFQGDQYVATCSASAQLTSRQLGELIALFDTYQFGALRTSYTREHWTDDSTVITQYRPPGAPPMHVEHYHGDTDAPARLTVLEDRIDTVIGTMEWVTGAN